MSPTQHPSYIKSCQQGPKVTHYLPHPSFCSICHRHKSLRTLASSNFMLVHGLSSRVCSTTVSLTILWRLRLQKVWEMVTIKSLTLLVPKCANDLNWILAKGKAQHYVFYKSEPGSNKNTKMPLSAVTVWCSCDLPIKWRSQCPRKLQCYCFCLGYMTKQIV